jgi:hypothetical protein
MATVNALTPARATQERGHLIAYLMTAAHAFIRNPDAVAKWTFDTVPTASHYPPGTTAYTSDEGLVVSNGTSWVLGIAAYAAGNTSTASVPNLAHGANQARTQNGDVTWGVPTNPAYVSQPLTLFVTHDTSSTSFTTAWNAAYCDAPTIAAKCGGEHQSGVPVYLR